MGVISIRPLGEARQIVESIGHEITYFYDDLVFADNNMYILRFNDEKQNQLFLHFNKDCEEAVASKVEIALREAAKSVKFQIFKAEDYSIDQKEGSEELQISFGN